MFSTTDVAEYYNTTQVHYERWWSLRTGLSLHYGIWDADTRSHAEALMNTNQVLMDKVGIQAGDQVLDAGCGVGGAAWFINKKTGAEVTGITLSENQVAYATAMARERGISNKVRFLQMDYTQTDFADESFDVVWACESVSTAPDKLLFIKEAFRVLKKGGRLIMSDCFITREDQHDPQSLVKKWGETWAVPNLVTINFFEKGLKDTGFEAVESFDYTDKVYRSARWMYYGYLAGIIPCEGYKLVNPKVSRFARNHYKCGLYQWKTLKRGLWRYGIVKAVK